MLALDIGNSRIKWAYFKEQKIVKKNALAYDLNSIDKLLKKELLAFTGSDVLISNVAGNEVRQKVSEYFASAGTGKVFFASTQSQQLGVENAYNTSTNLGVDRWLAMLAAFNHETRKLNEAVCIVDCGTALTIDVISAGGKHIGGLIMPGLRTMYRSLLNKSGVSQGVSLEGRGEQGYKLKNGVSRGNKTLGNTTTECVELGCNQLMLEGVSGIIRKQREQIRDLRCFVTGGDAVSVLEHVGENSSHEPDLILWGLFLAGADY